MLRSLNELVGRAIRGLDDVLGHVGDFYFGDRAWAVRYMVANTGVWFKGKQVLVWAGAVEIPDPQQGRVAVALSRKQIEESPPIEADRPVSRQQEAALFDHFGWVPYWQIAGGGYLQGGPAPIVGGLEAPVKIERNERDEDEESGDPNLRSVNEVTGYGIEASDGSIGHVEEFIAETDDWLIRYLAVDTRNWLPGRKVLVATDWINRIDWDERAVYIDMSRERIQSSPAYDPSDPVNREYEVRLYDYYGRPAYWR